MPAASPSIAASQNTSFCVSLKPMLGRCTTRALTVNQTMNAWLFLDMNQGNGE
jgi:hypothetical protein